MAKYRLLIDHYLFERILPAGTIIGDDSPYPFDGEPSNQMEGLDEASKGLIEKRYAGLMGGPVASLDINGNAPGGGEADPLLVSVGNPPAPPQSESVLIPAFPPPNENNGSIMSPLHQEFPTAISIPDFSKPEGERQQDAAAIVGGEDAPEVSTGSQEPAKSATESVLDAPAASIGTPAPTVSGKPLSDILK